MICRTTLNLLPPPLCSCLCYPTYGINSCNLEDVLKFCARTVNQRWDLDYSLLLHFELHWSILPTRMKKQKMLVCFCIVKGLSTVPNYFFTSHTCPNLRHKSLRSFVISCVPLSHSHLSYYLDFAVPLTELFTKLPFQRYFF